MAEKRDSNSEKLSAWLSSWETDYVEEWERQREVEDLLHSENEQQMSQKLWSTFQNCASTIAKLYKDGSHPNCVSLWVPFQNAASAVTQLQKDSQDAVARSYETGKARGHQRRTQELLAWAKKRRRHIRREDLIGFLLGGKVPPVRYPRASPRHGVASRTAASEDGPSEPDLTTFRDALALQGLDGAMSNINMGRHTTPPPSNNDGEPPTCHAHTSSPRQTDDFHGFILDEMSRRCGGRKRSAPSELPRHDSPSRKRWRLWREDDDPSPLC